MHWQRQVCYTGAYGEVRKCYNRENGDLRAVKIINKKYLEEDEKEKLLNEVDVLKHMDHPSILKLYEFYQDKKYYYLVTEYCSGGELFDKISEELYFNERDAANIMKQVFSGIFYCHQKNIVHRDLKPENLLLDKDTENPKIKIIDFGTSQQFDPSKSMNKKFGTPYYIAPEVLNRAYNEKCDVWSCGVIIYILLCGYPPFNGANDKQIIDSVLKGKFTLDEPEWDEVSDEAKDLLRKILTDSDKRISAGDALQHPWFKKFAAQDKIDKALATKTLSNLKNFRADQKLKQATLTFIASQLVNKDETEQLEKVFKAIDENGDGQLSKQEILNGWEKHIGTPMNEEQVDEMFRQIDTDGNGTIDYTEFVMATMNEKQLMSSDKLEAAFKMFDKDGSGSISPDEIKSALGLEAGKDSPQIDQIIKEVDVNGDGEISYDEFVQMMKKITSN